MNDVLKFMLGGAAAAVGAGVVIYAFGDGIERHVGQQAGRGVAEGAALKFPKLASMVSGSRRGVYR
jgi:hypothetical protein